MIPSYEKTFPRVSLRRFHFSFGFRWKLRRLWRKKQRGGKGKGCYETEPRDYPLDTPAGSKKERLGENPALFFFSQGANCG